MSQAWFDPSCKWMLEEHGSSILHLAGITNVLSCRARKAEVVQPRKLPDGLLEARVAGLKEPQSILVEVATYPEKRVVTQVSDDLRLVRQARGILADAIVLCLCPRGKYRVPNSTQQVSPLGWSAESLSWKVVELWTLSAEELLTAPDVAVVLWAPLARFDDPPEVLLQRCRNRIDREGGSQHANLLAVAQVFARLHHDKPEWMEIFGGRQAMIQSPVIREIIEESECSGQVKLIVHILTTKFGAVTPTIEAGLALIKKPKQLLQLGAQASSCTDLRAFESALEEKLPRPQPASTRGKQKPRKSEE